MPDIIIAIDGYSSCGKSTLAREIANATGYRYIDTGAMYRAVALFLIRSQTDIHHPDHVEEILHDITIDFKYNAEKQTQETLLNGENVEEEIRINSRVASIVSDVSALSSVRKYLVHLQHDMGKSKGIVMDGRDIGTVVYPQAELKLFITADPSVRAERRLKELAEKGQFTTYEEVFNNLQKRDHLDTTREDSPLVKATDAIVIDNTHLTREQQFTMSMEWVRQKMQQGSH